MAAEYQEFDWHVVDYAPFCLDDRIIDRSTKRPLWIRGPKPQGLEPGGYFVCLGAAQTFGRFCALPFPTLLSQRLGLPVLNISHGGAGPAFFCGDNAALLEYLNAAAFVVVQVMSGRSDSNSLFESEGVGWLRRRSDGSYVGADDAFTELIGKGPQQLLKRVVEETRQSWCKSNEALLRAVKVPKVLLWLSTRAPDYRQSWSSLIGLYGEFPQLVNGPMIEEVRCHCDRFVSVVTKRGLPQKLVDRFTGERTRIVDSWNSKGWTQNWYYPSPEMHLDAADALEPVCRELMSRPQSTLESP